MAEPTTDWKAVEAYPEFRELVASRQRFVVRVGGVAMLLAFAFVVLSGVAPDLLGEQIIGKMSLGFLGGVAMVVMTWIVTYWYMRRSDRVWGPLERQVLARAERDRGGASANGRANGRGEVAR